MVNQLRYQGDRRNLEQIQLVGPDTGGAFYRPRECEYDPETDTSTVYFAHVPTEELPREAFLMAAQQRAIRMRIKTAEDSLKMYGPKRPPSENYVPSGVTL